MKQVSVITGGHGGMGKAIARELGVETALVLADINEEKLAQTKAMFDELGMEAYTFKVDVTDRECVKALAEFAAGIGEVKNVIHTAGVSPAQCLTEPVMKINAIGTINITEEFYKVISEGGVMINFGSVAAYQMDFENEWIPIFEAYEDDDFLEKMIGLTESMSFDPFIQAGTAYAISKHFAIYYTKMNVERFYAKGVRILSVSPGSYLTPMHQALIDNEPDTADGQLDLIPTGRWGHPYEMGALIKFLCSKGAGFIGGIDILADGGQIANVFITQI